MYTQLHAEPASTVWRRFAIWSVLALIIMLAVGGLGRYSGLIVLGWALGAVISGGIILLRQR